MSNKPKRPEIKKQKSFKELEEKFNADRASVSPDIQKFLDSKGLGARWVSIDQIKRNDGYHRNGWEPFKRPKELASPFSFLSGNDAEGYVRNGDLILAVKKKEDIAEHKQWLQHKASQASVKQKQKRTKREMQDFIQQTGMSDYMSVSDGYDND